MVPCEFCLQLVPGVGRYTIGGYAGLMVCTPCYGCILSHEHQPYARITQEVYRKVGLRPAAMVARALTGGK